MWYGPENQDGGMRKHRPATLENRWGQSNKKQDMTAEPCPGSNKPFARFNNDAEETTSVNDQQPAARTAADLPEGTRVISPEGRHGTTMGRWTGRVTIEGHANFGREYTGVKWDGDEKSPWGETGRPFIDELRIETAPEASADELTETAPRYIVHSFSAGQHVVFGLQDTVTKIDVASFYSRYAARDKRDRLEAELTATETRETQLAQEFPTEGPKCGHGFALRTGVTSSVKCEFGHEYGVFGDEGPIDRADCAIQAANDAAFYAAKDDGDTEYVVKVICPEHDDQAADICEDCNAESDNDEDEE
jgi:hypothetical protein